MTPSRQIEAGELMLGQNNFTTMFAKPLLAATPENQVVKRRRKAGSQIAADQIAQLERELASLQVQVKSVEETYGLDNLHLTVARGYIRKLFSNARVVRWINLNRPEYLAELQAIAEIESISLAPDAAE